MVLVTLNENGTPKKGPTETQAEQLKGEKKNHKKK